MTICRLTLDSCYLSRTGFIKSTEPQTAFSLQSVCQAILIHKLQLLFNMSNGRSSLHQRGNKKTNLFSGLVSQLFILHIKTIKFYLLLADPKHSLMAEIRDKKIAYVIK